MTGKKTPLLKPGPALKIFEHLREDTRPEGYDDSQAHADFRRVLLGSEAGKRVFFQIIDWCGLFRTSMSSKQGFAEFKEGRRDVGLKVLEAVYSEPSEEAPLAEKTESEDTEL